MGFKYSSGVNNHSSKAAKLISSINEGMKRIIGREMLALEKQQGAMDPTHKTAITCLPYYMIWVAITNAKNDYTARAVLQTILQAPSQLSQNRIRSLALSAWVAGLSLPYASPLSSLRSASSVSDSMLSYLDIISPTISTSAVLKAIIETAKDYFALQELCNLHLQQFREFMVTVEAWRNDAFHACEMLKLELKPYLDVMANSAEGNMDFE